MLWLRVPLSLNVECAVTMTKPPSREEVLALIAYLHVYLAEPPAPRDAGAR